MSNENNEKKKLQVELTQRITAYITAAFGLVAGLAWNDAIKSFIELIFPIKKETVTVKFIYAILITIVVVIIGSYIVKILQKEK